jgi:hypothetical protein
MVNAAIAFFQFSQWDTCIYATFHYSNLLLHLQWFERSSPMRTNLYTWSFSYVPLTQVWAAGFSAAMLKKSSTLTGPAADSPDGSTLNGALNKVNSVSDLTKPSWGETFLLSTLHKFFEIVLHVPDVNQLSPFTINNYCPGFMVLTAHIFAVLKSAKVYALKQDIQCGYIFGGGFMLFNYSIS